jgi:CRP-like cAMP-binding protein
MKSAFALHFFENTTKEFMPSSFAELEPNVEPLGTISDFIDEFVEVVQTEPLFVGFSREQTAILAGYLDCYGVPSKSVVVREGDEGDFLAILVTGSARIVKTFKDSEEIICELKPGDMIGEMSLVDGQRRFASCITVDPCDFAVLTNENLHKLLAEHHVLGNKFLLMLLSVTVDRLRQSTLTMVPSLTPKSV